MSNFETLQQIESAVLISISGDVSRRQQAFEYLEQIKSNPTQSISIGFEVFQSNRTFDPLVKHFALQLIEETIKYKWTSLEPTLKISIKERLWSLMTENQTLPTHLKTILVRCVCEIGKREWPQQWPSFLNELVTLATSNPKSSDYSLLILAYLVEDVIVLQTLTAVRKRDIQTTLLQHGQELVDFIEKFLDGSTTTTSSALYALTMFATFLPIEIFFTTKIIQRIVVLLQFDQHRMKAAEFLSVIADRRGKHEERLGLLELFSYLFQPTSPQNDLFSAIQQRQTSDTYDFMKQYAMILAALTEQLCYLCGNEDTQKRAPLPSNFTNGTFFQILLRLMQHPSIYISLFGYQMWLQLHRANIFQQNDFQTIVPLVLQALCHSLVKLPFKTKENDRDVASYYIHLDFEDESDYQKYVGKTRSVLIRSINSVCETAENLTIAIRIGFDYADFCFQPNQQGNLLRIESLVVYWQVIEKHLRILLKKGSTFNENSFLNETDATNFCQRGQTFLEQLLSINADGNLEFLAFSLRLITCFYVFTRGDSTWTQRILGHLFRMITTERPNISKMNPLQKQASSMIDLCLNYGHVIYVYFNDLFRVTNDLVRQQTSADPQRSKLAGWQWSILVESLGILLNYSDSFEQQANLIHELVRPFSEILNKFNVQVHNLNDFINYLSLKTELCSDPNSVPIDQRLMFLTVHILCGFLRRISIPTDPSICLKGGYQETIDEIVFIRNPAAPAFIPMTQSLFKLLTFCHALHSPNSALDQSSSSFLCTMTDAEKAVYLQQRDANDDGNVLSSTIRSNTSTLSANDRRLHNRFSSFFDRLQILIGTFLTLKPDLYKLPDALNLVGTTLFTSFDHLPDFRLRNLIRNCFLPFVRHCPNATMLTAIVEPLFPFMYTKLKDKWKIIADRQTVQVTNGSNQETNGGAADDHHTQDQCEEEVIEEQVICYLTRDFIDVIRCFLTWQINTNQISNNHLHDIDETSMDEMITTNHDEQNNGDNLTRKTTNTTRSTSIPSDSTMKILQNSSTITRACLSIIFDGLSWPETSTVTKMSHLCQSFIKHLSTLTSVDQEFLRQLYIYILCALKTHGDNEPIVCTLLSLAISIYETYQSTHPNLFESVLSEIPGVTGEQVNIYRDKMQRQTNGKPSSDKQKREILKTLVQPLMGLNVAQMFRREPLALNDLPPLIRFSKRSLHPLFQQRQSNLDVENNEDHGLANLFQQNDD